MKFIAQLQRHGLPVVAVLTGATAALSGFGQQKASMARAEPAFAAKVAPAQPQVASGSGELVPVPPDGQDMDLGQSISGEVLEQIDVEKYSYLRLGEKGSTGAWAAVPATTSHLGERVTVVNAELMTQFASVSLKRTFQTIYFGLLDSPSEPSPPPGAARGQPSEPSHPEAPAGGEYAGNRPHPGAGPSADRVRVGHVERAMGPLGRTVVELSASRPEATGQKARVRAIVVKSTSGVMGRTFLHVRDGSGEVSTGSNDLAVTTTLAPAVGAEVVLEGTIEVDKDFGSGYRYRVLLSDATLVTN